MATPSIRLLAGLVLLCAVCASAEPPKTAPPGTAAPHSSGDWGPDEATMRDRAADIMYRLLVAAKEGVEVDGKKIVYSKTPDFVVDLNNIVIGGSPAAAFSAGLGMNSPGRTIGGVNHSAKDLVYTTNALYTMGDQPEVAMFLAHEVGHLANGDAQTLETKKKEIIDKLFDEWLVSHDVPDGENPSVTANRFFRDSQAKVQEKLNPIQQPLEDAADRYGRALAVKAGYPAEASVTSFQRAQDWLWALKLELNDPNHAGSVADRAAKNAKWVVDAKAAKERAAVATRRAKCAAEGTSCP